MARKQIEFTADQVKMMAALLKQKSKKSQPPKKKPASDKEKRSRWIQYVLYPDNRYHAQYLDWCKTHAIGWYIVHDGEGSVPECGFVSSQKEETKKHIHCCQYFENARTATAFIKSLGTVNYWVVEENEDGTPTLLSSIPLGIDEQERTVTKPFLSRAESVHDINAVAHYFIHDNFECHMLGKKEYSREDVKMFNNDRSLYDRYFSDELPTNHATLSLLRELWKLANGNKEKYLDLVLECGDTRALKYMESRAFFINEFVCGGNLNCGGKNNDKR